MRMFPAFRVRSAVIGATTLLVALAGAARAEDGLTAEEVVQPDSAAASSADAPVLSPVERAQILRRLHDRRDRMAGLALAAPPVAGTDTDVQAVPPTVIGGPGSEVPGALVIGRSLRNPKPQLATNSTLAEPAAVNWRNKVLYAGNFAHLEWSQDHGTTYTSIAVPGGPADARIACCDNDIVMDSGGVAYHSLLYVNSATTNGVVRLFVRPQGGNFAASCSYTYDPAGAANNILPDYPHIALSKNYLYLTVNAIGETTGSSIIRRYNLAQLRSCNPVTVQTYKVDWGALGQRVWTPAEGALNSERMMWIQHESANSIRVFDWPENRSTPVSYVRAVGKSSFTNPDCRGGTGNFDFIERETAWSIAGFRTRCTIAAGAEQPGGAILACYWHSAKQYPYPHAHIRAAHISIASKTVVDEPHIWTTNACYGYPAVTSNSIGAIGFSLAYGGKTGGDGPAVKGAVGMSDTTYGRNFAVAADGVAMRADGRFGDYMTVRRYNGCGRWFGATSYAWDGSPVDSASDVNARWVEFGREADQVCWVVGQ